jgi:hypothetical protein
MQRFNNDKMVVNRSYLCICYGQISGNMVRSRYTQVNINVNIGFDMSE